ncbi:uncharacterized protein TNCV_2086991 [Trichonephila clavipes]|nr:uncharacterized protein TNCV_2086991 [Trichonephila clavipes]
MVRTGVVIHKQKFSTHGAPKQTYMLFQNDIPIDVVCHHYTLNMQVSSGTKNNSSPNEPCCTTVTVSFNVPSRHGGTLNNSRAGSPLVRLVEGKEMREAPDLPQVVHPQNCDENELNRFVINMMLKATANDRRHLALCHDESRGP